MIEILWGLAIGTVFLLAWIGGSHTGMRQNRILGQTQTELLTENGKLRLEIEELKSMIFGLQRQVEDYQRQVDNLSAQIAIIRRDPNQNFTGG